MKLHCLTCSNEFELDCHILDVDIKCPCCGSVYVDRIIDCLIESEIPW